MSPASPSPAPKRPRLEGSLAFSAVHLIFFPVMAGLVVGIVGLAYNHLPSHQLQAETLRRYLAQAERVESAVSSIVRLRDQPAPQPDLTLLTQNRKEPAPAARTTADIAQAFLDLKIEGIMVRKGTPLAIINNELVELNQVVAGVRVLSIENNQITVVDDAGKEHIFSIFAKLDQYQTSPEEPLFQMPAPLGEDQPPN